MEVEDDKKKKTKPVRERKIAARKIFVVTRKKAKEGANKLKFSNKKAVIKDNMKRINDEVLIDNASKVSELNEFRRIYYNEEDYITEQNMVDKKKYGTKLEIIKGLLLARVREFKRDVQNLSYEDEVIKLNEEEGNKDELNSEEFKEALNIFRENIQNEEKPFDFDGNVNVLKVEKFLTIERNSSKDERLSESYNNIINNLSSNFPSTTSNNVSNNNINNINNLEKTMSFNGNETNIRNFAKTMYKENLEKSEMALNNASNIIRELEENKGAIIGNNFDEIYNNLNNTTMAENQFAKFMETFKNQNNRTSEKILLELIPVVACLVKENMRLKNALKEVVNYESIKKKNEILEAKKSDKGNTFNKEVIKNERENDLRNKGVWVEDEIWKKKNLIDKITERFSFNDFRQNPYVHSWNRLTADEKIKFIRMKLEWRKNRIKDLLKFEYKNSYDYRVANNFSYYEWRDPDGILVPIYDCADKLGFYNSELINEKDQLRTILNKGSNKNLVRGFIKDNGETKILKGKAWFHMPKTGFLGRKTKFSNQGKKKKDF